MPVYVIHVGPHKTGSTYLQASFASMRSFLMNAGVLYPEHWQDGAGHVGLVRRLRSLDPTLREEFAEINRSAPRVVLLSAEDLSDLRKYAADYLGQCIGDNKTTVVYYCRRWSELLASGWQELVKHGQTMPLVEFFTSHVVNPYLSHVMNYDICLRLFGEVFGGDNLRLVSYSELMDNGVDLLPHFFANFLQISEPPQRDRMIINASMGVFDSELVRALNAMEWAAGGPKGNRSYRAFLHARPRPDVQSLVQAMERAKRTLRMNEAAGSLLSLHQQLAAQYGPAMVAPRPGQFLFKPRLSDIPHIGCEYLMCDGVMERLKEIREELKLADPVAVT